MQCVILAYIGLAANPYTEGADCFIVVLAHVVEGHPCHHNVLLPDGKSFYGPQDFLL